MSGFGSGGYGTGGYGAGGTRPEGSLPALDYYLGLLTSQYKNASKLISWLTACLTPLRDAGVTLGQFVNAFDIDAAVGVQLDILGLIVGAGRTVPFQPSNGVSPILDDPTYRIYLKARIGQNQWNGQTASLYSLWARLFPGGVIAIQDNQNMTATIFLAGSFNSILRDLIVNGYIIPRPEGVLYNFVMGTLPTFGFDLNNEWVAGFDLGHFA